MRRAFSGWRSDGGMAMTSPTGETMHCSFNELVFLGFGVLDEGVWDVEGHGR